MQAEIENTTTHRAWCVMHPLSPEDSVAMTALRSAVGGMKGKLEGTAARVPFNGIMERAAAPGGVAFAADTVGGSEAYLAGGPRRRRLGRGPRSFTCMVAGSTWERPRRSATSSAISR